MMDVGARILEEMQKNPVWPFEPNYLEMTPQQQQESRLRVLTAWYDLEDPKILIADRWAFVRAMVLFLEYYIKGWDENRQWYSLPTPPMHYQWIWESTFPVTAIAAYRSSGKSTLIGKNLPMFVALTRPRTILGVVLINMSMGQERGREIQRQLEENPRILADFGNQRGKRGGRTWNTRYLELPNGSVIKIGTVKSAMRGGRPHWFILDDPEKDAEMNNPELLAAFRRELLRVMLPTLDPGRFFTWIGTLINVRAVLHNVIHGNDPQFKHWNRVNIMLIQTDEHGNEYSTWEAKYSVADSKMMQGAGSEDGRIKGIGRAAFMAEYQNQPVPDDQYSFRYDPVAHGYHILMESGRRQVVDREQTLDYDRWLSGLRKVVAIDPAYVIGPEADFTCALAAGLDREGLLWALEYVLRRMTPTETVQHVFRLCETYHVDLVGCEANGLQTMYYSQLQDQMYAWMAAGRTGQIPRIIPVQVGRASKGERIQSLEWRFNSGKIRVRRQVDEQDVGMEELEEQIMYFTPSLAGLKHDDAIDALEIAQRVLAQTGRLPEERKEPEREPITQMMEELGIQSRYLNASLIPMDQVYERVRKQIQGQNEGGKNGKFDPSLI